jgi:hypothetical protein
MRGGVGVLREVLELDQVVAVSQTARDGQWSLQVLVECRSRELLRVCCLWWSEDSAGTLCRDKGQVNLATPVQPFHIS